MSGPRTNPAPGLIERFGCTVEEWRTLRDIGTEMRRAGRSRDVTPLRAYANQRRAAINGRHIGWELTLWQWWTIWQDSGHWHERGIGRGYMMCRHGDTGPYAVGNVFIGPGVENTAAANKKSGLPVGVRLLATAKHKRFQAVCVVGGKQRYLGAHATIQEAREAYLAAVQVDISQQRAVA